LLLNPRDGLTIKVIARDLTRDVTCHYRIVGVARMDDGASLRQRENQRSQLRKLIGEALGMDAFVAFFSLAVASAAVFSFPHLFSSGEEQTKTETIIKLPDGRQL
jgi:hypothetical protein